MSPAHDVNPQRPPVYLRTLARRLERELRANPESAAEWVNVWNEANFDPPVATWHYDDASLHVSLSRGLSEGYLLHVYAQESSRNPEALVLLLRVKLLCNRDRAVQEMGAVWSFLDSDGFRAVLSGDTA